MYLFKSFFGRTSFTFRCRWSDIEFSALFALLAAGDVGVDPKLAVSILFILGSCCNFIFNKRWSFSHRGGYGKTGLRYFCLYAGLCLINILTILFFVDFLEFPHAIVQAGVILFFIPILFFVQRYWVFRNNSAVSS